jgi:acyl-CoA-binding protein
MVTDDLKAQFEAAAKAATNLPERPDNDTLLKLYAYYKQGTVGDVQGKRPGFTDFAGRAKYDAWKKLKGMPLDEAMKRYIKLVQRLQGQGG